MRDLIDVYALARDRCAICHVDDVCPVEKAANSIQCNGRYKISKTVANYDELLGPEGCKAWFHKECLKKWHVQCIETTGNGATCPLCREKNSFIWSFHKDFELGSCIFREDFLQYGLMEQQWEVSELSALVVNRDLSLKYMNKPERDSNLPAWVNISRDAGGLLASAVLGADLQVVQYLVENKAYVPGWTDPEDEDLSFLNSGNQSILMLAAHAFSEDEFADSRIFAYIARIGCIYDELQSFPAYMVEEDVILFVIRHGYVNLLQVLLSTPISHKHEARVLLHWSLRNRDPNMRTFSALILWCEYSFPAEVFEKLLLSCADEDLFRNHKLESVFGLISEDLRERFLTREICNVIKLQNLDMLKHILYDTGPFMLRHLKVKHCNQIVNALGLVLNSTWRRTFDYRQGTTLVSASHTLASYAGYMRDHCKSKISKEKTPFQFSSEYEFYNFYELLFMKLRSLGLSASTEACQNLMLQFHNSVEEKVLVGIVREGKLLKTFMERVTNAVVGYCPSVLNNDTGDTNIMIANAKSGRVHLFRRIFVKHRPNFAVTDWKGRNCLHLAVFHENTALVNFLVKSMPKSARSSLDLNQGDYRRRTVLMTTTSTISQPWGNRNPKKKNANKKEVLRIVRCLLSCPELNVNAQDNEKNTALHLAYRTGNEEIADLLTNLAAGLDTALVNADGLSAGSERI